MSKCISCGGATHPWLSMPLDAKKGVPTPFGDVVRCEACGLMAVSPLPPVEDIGSHYELPAYYTHGDGHMPSVRATVADRLLVKLAWWFDRGEFFDPALVGLRPRLSVCDLGCGQGHVLEQFLKGGCEVVGVDPDAAARAQASKRGVTVLDGTAEALPPELDGRTFDVVIMTHALEHCRDPVAAVANAYRLTKPGGLFYCEVPNAACSHFQTFTICSEMFDVPRHLYFFTPKALELLMEKSGFSCEKVVFSGYTRHHSPSWRAWERAIYRMVRGEGPATEHTFLRSLALAASTLLASPAEKYDCMGVLARREEIARA